MGEGWDEGETVSHKPDTFGNRPVLLTYRPDDSDRIVVIEQDGKILIFDNSPETTQANTFPNLSNQIARNGNEEGLFGLAFHPLYSSNGHFYVHYSAARPRRSVISQFTVSDNPNMADPFSEKIILEVLQPHSNHNAECLRSDPMATSTSDSETAVPAATQRKTAKTQRRSSGRLFASTHTHLLAV
ncbi:MAG TPA: hypothetical protein EYQ61_09175 [Dehalococcoidia bacterium]|nr:hypothetical protein [Dehalococcoidia bacterium]